MITEQRSLAGSRPTARKLDILAAFFWALLSVIPISVFLVRPSVLQAGQVIFYLSAVVLFIVRRPARAHGPRYAFWLATMATFLPVLGMRPAPAGLVLVGEFVQCAGLAVMLVAILTLSRSFGIAPAHRGLVMRGIYRVVRHPLYAGEILALLGYCLGFMSTRNWVILLLLAAAQIARIFIEERLLSGDSEYRAYQQRVRWRLVPRIW